MQESEKPKLDWVHLPPGAKVTSLWESLHDGELISIQSDSLERALSLEFLVGHVNDFHKLPEDLTFRFEIESVSSVRVTKWRPFPGDCVVPPGSSRQEQAKVIAEYHAKGREESDSWEAFERACARGEFEDLEVSHAEVAEDEEGTAALRLEIVVDDEAYRQLFIVGNRIQVTRSDKQPVTMDQFVSLGNAYWKDFAEGSESVEKQQK